MKCSRFAQENPLRTMSLAVLGVAGVTVFYLLVALPHLLHPSPVSDVVVTGVVRPLQLLVDERRLVILSPCAQAECAGQIHRVDLDGKLPADLSRQPPIRIQWIDPRMAVLGSLALHPVTRELFLGEENGRRVYRWSEDGRLTLYATGLHRLAGGSTLAFDPLGRLVIVDYVDHGRSEDEDRGPPELEILRDEDYRGPAVWRLTLDPLIPLPRRLDRVPPLLPPAWRGGARGTPLPPLIGVAPLGTGELVFLTVGGQLVRRAADGTLAALAQLPPGHYLRTNMIAAADGTVFVSGGFWVTSVFRVSPDGSVKTLATRLADPQGIALDARGNLYVAESALHRVIRLSAR